MVVGKFGVCFLNHLYDFVLFGGIGVCYRSQGICVDYRRLVFVLSNKFIIRFAWNYTSIYLKLRKYCNFRPNSAWHVISAQD